MNRREFLSSSASLVAASLAVASGDVPQIEVWQGLRQRAAQFGDSQDDFNLLGHVNSQVPLAELTYSVNGDATTNLRFRTYRRIVADGDFNADIPIARLRPGNNRVRIEAVDKHGTRSHVDVIVNRVKHGEYPLPVTIKWRSVKRLDDVGLCTDGKWTFGPQGLRTAQVGYDRVFLIGNRAWRDYEVTAPVTIHALATNEGPQSGDVRHAGFCLRWAGHSWENNRPLEQPKWGLHPRGGIVWLTVRKGKLPPYREFYPGGTEHFRSFQPFSGFELGRPFWMKGRCKTLPEDSAELGITRYSFKVWNIGETEPAKWNFEVVQQSASSLRRADLRW